MAIALSFGLCCLAETNQGGVARMKQNKYDDKEFFSSYSRMPRSLGGLDAAGEWSTLRGMLPDLEGKRVLDLGCGFG
ncbi:hypothetical protein BN871_BA_00290 [Paenibacillus sp. P22]|nr:hypothetical protein BN871_BA_00290 [Paenibacillus sp. P22]